MGMRTKCVLPASCSIVIEFVEQPASLLRATIEISGTFRLFVVVAGRNPELTESSGNVCGTQIFFGSLIAISLRVLTTCSHLHFFTFPHFHTTLTLIKQYRQHVCHWY